MASKSRAVRSKRTKDQLIDEMEELEAKLRNAEPQDPTTALIAKSSASAARTAVKDLSIDSLVAEGAKFGLAAQRAVSVVTEEAVKKAEELKAIQEAIEVETVELERLYGLDVASASLKALVEDHAREKARLDRELELAQIAWNESAAAHIKEVAQRNKELETARAREQQEYNYRLEQERKRDIDNFNYSMQNSKRTEADRVAAVNKALADREAAVKAQEESVGKQAERLANLDGEIKKATDAAVAIATNSVKKDLSAAWALERKDLENQLALQAAKTKTAEDNCKILVMSLDKVESQLAEARQQVTDVTTAALQSASGAQALAAVRETVKDSVSPAKTK